MGITRTALPSSAQSGDEKGQADRDPDVVPHGDCERAHVLAVESPQEPPQGRRACKGPHSRGRRSGNQSGLFKDTWEPHHLARSMQRIIIATATVYPTVLTVNVLNHFCFGLHVLEIPRWQLFEPVHFLFTSAQAVRISVAVTFRCTKTAVKLRHESLVSKMVVMVVTSSVSFRVLHRWFSTLAAFSPQGTEGTLYGTHLSRASKRIQGASFDLARWFSLRSNPVKRKVLSRGTTVSPDRRSDKLVRMRRTCPSRGWYHVILCENGVHTQQLLKQWTCTHPDFVAHLCSILRSCVSLSLAVRVYHH